MCRRCGSHLRPRSRQTQHGGPRGIGRHRHVIRRISPGRMPTIGPACVPAECCSPSFTRCRRRSKKAREDKQLRQQRPRPAPETIRGFPALANAVRLASPRLASPRTDDQRLLCMSDAWPTPTRDARSAIAREPINVLPAHLASNHPADTRNPRRNDAVTAVLTTSVADRTRLRRCVHGCQLSRFVAIVTMR